MNSSIKVIAANLTPGVGFESSGEILLYISSIMTPLYDLSHLMCYSNISSIHIMINQCCYFSS